MYWIRHVRRRTLSTVLSLSALLVLSGAVYLFQEQQRIGVCGVRTCNVILIVSDTLAARHMGTYGYARNTTPFIDSFFQTRGIVYEHAVAPSHWTLPSIASLFHGKYASKLTFADVVGNSKTLTAYLLQAEVAQIGFLKGVAPLNEATDSFILSTIGENFRAHDIPYTSTPYQEHETGFENARTWIESRSTNEPYFMFIHDTTVHGPYDPPVEYRHLFSELKELSYPIERAQIAQAAKNEIEKTDITLAYDQEVRYLDDQFKRFIEGLSVEALESTVIILTADHGEAFGLHDEYFGHGPSHGEGDDTLFEEVIHVPLLMYIPGAHVRRIENSVSLLDIMPTILEFFDVAVPFGVDGVSLLSETKIHERRILFSEHGDTLVPLELFRTTDIRDLDDELIQQLLIPFDEHYLQSVVNNQVKSIFSPHETRTFNLLTDPLEEQSRTGAEELLEKTLTP